MRNVVETWDNILFYHKHWSIYSKASVILPSNYHGLLCIAKTSFVPL